MKNIFLLAFVSLQVLCAASTFGSHEGRAFDIGLRRGPAGDWPKKSCVEASVENKKASIKISSKNYVLDRLIVEKLTEISSGEEVQNGPRLNQVFVSYPGFGSLVFIAEDRSVCKK
ncbi:hypothetical protein [Xanthomonas tesorieronis]|uniref:hypothetical protein n=1 Tax=Xanthomonas tesorieronis TaxID=3160839 RepID=UPI003511BF10